MGPTSPGPSSGGVSSALSPHEGDTDRLVSSETDPSHSSPAKAKADLRAFQLGDDKKKKKEKEKEKLKGSPKKKNQETPAKGEEKAKSKARKDSVELTRARSPELSSSQQRTKSPITTEALLGKKEKNPEPQDAKSLLKETSPTSPSQKGKASTVRAALFKETVKEVKSSADKESKAVEPSAAAQNMSETTKEGQKKKADTPIDSPHRQKAAAQKESQKEAPPPEKEKTNRPSDSPQKSSTTVPKETYPLPSATLPESTIVQQKKEPEEKEKETEKDDDEDLADVARSLSKPSWARLPTLKPSVSEEDLAQVARELSRPSWQRPSQSEGQQHSEDFKIEHQTAEAEKVATQPRKAPKPIAPAPLSPPSASQSPQAPDSLNSPEEAPAERKTKENEKEKQKQTETEDKGRSEKTSPKAKLRSSPMPRRRSGSPSDPSGAPPSPTKAGKKEEEKGKKEGNLAADKPRGIFEQIGSPTQSKNQKDSKESPKFKSKGGSPTPQTKHTAKSPSSPLPQPTETPPREDQPIPVSPRKSEDPNDTPVAASLPDSPPFKAVASPVFPTAVPVVGTAGADTPAGKAGTNSLEEKKSPEQRGSLLERREFARPLPPVEEEQLNSKPTEGPSSSSASPNAPTSSPMPSSPMPRASSLLKRGKRKATKDGVAPRISIEERRRSGVKERKSRDSSTIKPPVKSHDTLEDLLTSPLDESSISFQESQDPPPPFDPPIHAVPHFLTRLTLNDQMTEASEPALLIQSMLDPFLRPSSPLTQSFRESQSPLPVSPRKEGSFFSFDGVAPQPPPSDFERMRSDLSSPVASPPIASPPSRALANWRGVSSQMSRSRLSFCEDTVDFPSSQLASGTPKKKSRLTETEMVQIAEVGV
uniref:Uncharacterized protein n=1 Tax=Chromera velia CCMP2878 TaxID=1169474 RepID=A0A0G4FYW8_9ALVE|eukprot:Cvel_3891.t1-p1 / transcript=Cvel_3891.t1 / gene=Cvel_3891 / organism=Chromera_velia_CCMP2878 / gene_product=Neurofilament heavy polypeptide, putative / transcript_product=Neurofilament heavy polypeptide, putative / location=Cvel_scaffold165:2458-5082(-) / protein_length=875 / sequence_SO=supercontig / SO=protein_coding / is_pseudo=false